jgi:hypothetical protein
MRRKQFLFRRLSGITGAISHLPHFSLHPVRCSTMDNYRPRRAANYFIRLVLLRLFDAGGILF